MSSISGNVAALPHAGGGCDGQRRGVKMQRGDADVIAATPSANTLPADVDGEATAICLDGSADILCLIFAAVGRLNQQTLVWAIPTVCHRWRDVCQTHLRGIDINLKMAKDARRAADVPVFVAAVRAIAHRFRSTRAFGLTVCRSASDEWVDAVMPVYGETKGVVSRLRG